MIVTKPLKAKGGLLYQQSVMNINHFNLPCIQLYPQPHHYSNLTIRYFTLLQEQQRVVLENYHQILQIFMATQQHTNIQEPIEPPRESPSTRPPQSSVSIKKALTGLFMILGFKTERTVHCKHEQGCVESTLISFIRSFLLGYSIKSAISLVFSLKNLFKNPAKILRIFKSKDSLSFGMFMGCFSGMFKAVICIARRFFGETKIASIVAGFLAGSISSLFLQKSTRQNLALFLLTRALDTIYNSLKQRGIIPKWKYDYVLLYSLMMTVTGYCFGNQPGCLSPDMNKFYLKFTNESLSDLQMRQVWIERKNQTLAGKGIAPQNPLDYMPTLRKYYQSLQK